MTAVKDSTPTPPQTSHPARASAAVCHECGYALDGLQATLCPECGTTRPPANTAAPLGKKAAAGFMFMSGQSLITRVITFLAQIVLAKLLLPADFGLFAVAMGVVSFVTILQQIGVREILIARQKKFNTWANVGMWVSFAVACVSMLAIAASAPIASWYYADSRLLGLMLVLALSQPLYNLTIVHEAKLQIDLRFKELAFVNLVQGGLVPVLMVVCAWLGAGPYAFVVPRLVAGIVRAVMLQAWVKPPVHARPQTRYWKFIVLPGIVVLLTALANNIGAAAPALVLGKMCSQEVAGYFAFAFNITLQGVVLLAGTLDNVMFPTLGRLMDEPERQLQAYRRATRALAAAMVPMCALQALISQPLIGAIFGDKWEASVTVMQILSVGMIYFAAFIPAGSLLMAHGRFQTRLWIGVFWGLAFLAGAIVGAKFYGAEGVAVALSAAYLLSGLHIAAAAMKPIGGGLIDAVKVLLPSHLVGALASAAGFGMLHVLPSATRQDQIIEIFAVSIVFSACYALFLFLFAKDVWNDLLGTAAPILRKLGMPVGKPG